MEPTLPVSIQPAINVPTRDIEMPTGTQTGQNVTVELEHKLVEYIARLQVQGSYGQETANPAALGSEVLSVLKSYLDRASRLQNLQGGKVNVMSDNPLLSLETQEQAGLQNAVFTPGPAERYFEPAAPVGDNVAKVASPALSGADLDRAINMLSELLSFSFETSFIGTATANVSKSTNTLLHGQ
jgi:hypothetical protein